MLVGFLGVPCSGKTTIAAKLFANLKELGGMKSEIIVEQARHFIAEKRFNEKLSHLDPIILTEENQIEIYSKQRQLETIMKSSCSNDTIIVSDGSAFNTAIYLSDEFIANPNRPFFTDLSHHYDILFYCHPLNLKTLPEDPNRIHNLEQIIKLEEKSKKILNILRSSNVNVKELLGTLSVEQRYLSAVSQIMDLYVNINQRR